MQIVEIWDKQANGGKGGIIKRRAVDAKEIVSSDGARYSIGGKPDETPAPEKSKTLDELTVAELEALAKAKGVELGDAKKKADIVAVLEKAGAQPE